MVQTSNQRECETEAARVVENARYKSVGRYHEIVGGLSMRKIYLRVAAISPYRGRRVFLTGIPAHTIAPQRRILTHTAFTRRFGHSGTYSSGMFALMLISARKSILSVCSRLSHVSHFLISGHSFLQFPTTGGLPHLSMRLPFETGLFTPSLVSHVIEHLELGRSTGALALEIIDVKKADISNMHDAAKYVTARLARDSMR